MAGGGVSRAKPVMRASEPVTQRHHVAIGGNVIEEDRGGFTAAFFAQLEFRKRLGVGLRANIGNALQIADDP